MKRTIGFVAVILWVAVLLACENRTRAEESARASGGAATIADGPNGASNGAKAISPDFTLTTSDLRTMVGDMPGSIQDKILARPALFLREIAAILRQPSDYFALVDKSHALAAGYVPPDLVNLHAEGISVGAADMVFRKSVMPEVMAMVSAAREAGIEPVFPSTYRSFAVQRAVYDREVRLYGVKVADSESAVPGTSQHQLGDTVDFGCICDAFGRTKDYAWLIEHAAEFGFSMTYPNGYESVTGYRYEPWHWHYITTAGTRAQAAFFNNVQQYLIVFLYDNRRALVDSYLGNDLGAGWDTAPLSHPIGRGPGAAEAIPPKTQAPSGAPPVGSRSSSDSGRPAASSP